MNPKSSINVSVGGLCSNTIIADIISNCGENGKGYNALGKGEARGGNGGSGGGAGCFIRMNGWPRASCYGSSGGSDGGNGADSTGSYVDSMPNTITVNGGAGQGTTTRAFGEWWNTLYANGGKGGSIIANIGLDGYPRQPSVENGQYGNSEINGQGIAIIRWGY